MAYLNLADFTDQYEKISKILAQKDDIGRIEQMYLIFDNAIMLNIEVDIDTDEVMVSFEDVKKLGKNFVPILPEFYHIPLIRTWLMINHQGYQDAIQFEFWGKSDEKNNFLQVQAVASILYVYKLLET